MKGYIFILVLFFPLFAFLLGGAAHQGVMEVKTNATRRPHTLEKMASTPNISANSKLSSKSIEGFGPRSQSKVFPPPNVKFASSSHKRELDDSHPNPAGYVPEPRRGNPSGTRP